jgi:N-acetylglucosaminyldiphosphoundecaprenol N-acetyl-beta-D-mannosaminyltransferase
MGVTLANASMQEAIDVIEALVRAPDAASHGIYIVNAHALNLAAESESYRTALNAAHCVFGDGTGVRWAARVRGVQVKANLVGTDLVPELFRRTAGRGYRYYMLGADAATIERAAQTCARAFPGWSLAGFHHGYVNDDESAALAAIDRINAAGTHMLLVGMGNPLQELWIHRHLHRLRVPVSIGVGGLFDHWGGNLKRAPAWVRRRGIEWVQLLLQQPHKWRRYLLGNPKFVMRMLRSAAVERARALPPS